MSVGPVEQTIYDDYWIHDPKKVVDAVVLDAAGATSEDVEWALGAVDSHRARNDWGYFTAVIRNRIGERILAKRDAA